MLSVQGSPSAIFVYSLKLISETQCATGRHFTFIIISLMCKQRQRTARNLSWSVFPKASQQISNRAESGERAAISSPLALVRMMWRNAKNPIRAKLSLLVHLMLVPMGTDHVPSAPYWTKVFVVPQWLNEMFPYVSPWNAWKWPWLEDAGLRGCSDVAVAVSRWFKCCTAQKKRSGKLLWQPKHHHV